MKIDPKTGTGWLCSQMAKGENQWALLRKVVCRCLLERLVTVIKM